MVDPRRTELSEAGDVVRDLASEVGGVDTGESADETVEGILLSEDALSDWNRDEEEIAWEHLQPSPLDQA